MNVPESPGIIRVMEFRVDFGLLLLGCAVCASGCGPSLSSAQDSGNGSDNMISGAQHSLRRQDSISSVHTRDAVRHGSYELVNSPLRTASGTLGNTGTTRGRWEWLRAGAVADPKTLGSRQ